MKILIIILQFLDMSLINLDIRNISRQLIIFCTHLSIIF